MYIRVGKTDFLKDHVEGKTLTELREMFPHLSDANIRELHSKVGKKKKK